MFRRDSVGDPPLFLCCLVLAVAADSLVASVAVAADYLVAFAVAVAELAWLPQWQTEAH